MKGITGEIINDDNRACVQTKEVSGCARGSDPGREVCDGWVQVTRRH
jgi:hypothetical protein